MMVDNMKKIVVSRGKDQGENVRGIWGLFWFNPEESRRNREEAPY